MTHSSAIIATMSGAALIVALAPARATINSEYISENAAQACQLSLPRRSHTAGSSQDCCSCLFSR